MCLNTSNALQKGIKIRKRGRDEREGRPTWPEGEQRRGPSLLRLQPGAPIRPAFGDSRPFVTLVSYPFSASRSAAT